MENNNNVKSKIFGINKWYFWIAVTICFWGIKIFVDDSSVSALVEVLYVLGFFTWPFLTVDLLLPDAKQKTSSSLRATAVLILGLLALVILMFSSIKY